MKTLYSYLLLLCVVLFSACKGDEALSEEANVGYLRLSISENTATTPRSQPVDNYNPKQLAVTVTNASGTTVWSTNNWETVKDEKITLPVGTYTIKAASYGFDGDYASFDIPYYVGTATATIAQKGEDKAVAITCQLANVKVTVDFEQALLDAVNGVGVQVKSGNYSLSFKKDVTASGYFPVGNLTVVTSVTNKAGLTHIQTQDITEVKARDHYKLHYKMETTGSSNVEVTVDPTTHTYTYNIKVSTQPSSSASLSANAWSKLAYLTATDVTTKDGTSLDASQMKFEYKRSTASDTEWTSLAATASGDAYTATLTGLEPATTYEYRLVGGDDFATAKSTFTTEEATALYNGNFDNWYQYGKIWYAITETDATTYDSEKGYLLSFWDSGNVGTSIMSKNPTEQEKDEVHTSGGSSAKLSSQYVGLGSLGKFAAGNIYTGHYCETFMSPMGARLRFGQPFASRPTQLKGWYKYTRGTDVDQGNDPYKSTLQTSGGDQCAVYIALTDAPGFSDGLGGAFEINNKLTADDADNYKYRYAIDFSENNPHIIAYGSISEAEAKGTGDWQAFSIDLKYSDLTRKPTYIIVVASASKYGDYFTGSTKSVMYVDDFELVYDGTPVEE